MWIFLTLNSRSATGMQAHLVDTKMFCRWLPSEQGYSRLENTNKALLNTLSSIGNSFGWFHSYLIRFSFDFIVLNKL